MKWDFDGDGRWDAFSSVSDDGVMFRWRIVVCEDGTFSVSESDSELTDRKETFETLRDAKSWCAKHEEEFRLACQCDTNKEREMFLYSARFQAHDAPVDGEFLLLGIWTTFIAALGTARGAKMHNDDSWVVIQHKLNVIDPGQTVWDDWTDENRENAKIYSRFFPDGFPPELGSN